MYHYWFDGQQAPRHAADATCSTIRRSTSRSRSAGRTRTGRDGGTASTPTFSSVRATARAGPIGSTTTSLPALRDPRYITVDGRPLLVLYRVGQIKGAREAIERWKERARGGRPRRPPRARGQSRAAFRGTAQRRRGRLDGLVQFPPLTGIGLQSVKRLAAGRARHEGDVYSYDAAVNSADLATTSPSGLRIHPGVMPGWDNTPRRRELGLRLPRREPAARSGAGSRVRAPQPSPAAGRRCSS